jgi:hypothetical protein
VKAIRDIVAYNRAYFAGGWVSFCALLAVVL